MLNETELLEENSSPDDDAAHLLVVDDDNRIRDLLTRFLGANGFRVTSAPTAVEARRQLEGMMFDLLIVDIMMPGESGLELTQSLRESSDVPILMLTARAESEQRIEGLEVGADDYLSKPFEPRELLLRINNILPGFIDSLPMKQRGELRRGTEIVRITDREREMLRIFSGRPNETVQRHELLNASGANGERTVDVQINRLRRKIEADPANPIHLHTVRGIGYRLLVD